MKFEISGKNVTCIEQARELLDLAMIDGNSAVVGQCQYAISQFAPSTPEGIAAAAVLAAKWEKSRAEAKPPRFDPYASQRHMRGRKSHLAAAISQNIHNHPGMAWVWAIIFVVLIVGSSILAIFK